MNIAVIGSNGQLGGDVVRVFTHRGDDVRSLTHADIEVSNLKSVVDCLRSQGPEIVINTAAMHHVENCEREPSKAYAVNAVGARNLATVTRDLGAVLIHVSTDYVFDGKKDMPYVENDIPLPLNVYGNSKLAGEYFVRTLNPKHFVLRTSALYGKHPCRAKGGRNFVDLMLRLARERGHVRVVDSEFVSPTRTADVARQIAALTHCDGYGLYHATAEGSCSWYEFAREIFSVAEIEVKIEVASPTEFPARVPRPRYSVLENHGLKTMCLNQFEPWQVGIRKYVSEIQTTFLDQSASA
ncbi:MAG TPA: dTDP-4-dehydrorhamnose reductase [Terriglobales bacterium]|nr:dTDP-4-dehydrorhamnose reductase [Terriglobales bacterium]